MERKNVNLVELNDFLNERYNGRKIEIICVFLFEYVGKDLNILSETAEFNTSFFISSIIESDEILGFEVAYVPKKVLPEKIANDYPVDYKTCCRRIIFGTDGGFSLESCDVDFFISVPNSSLSSVSVVLALRLKSDIRSLALYFITIYNSPSVSFIALVQSTARFSSVIVTTPVSLPAT